MSSRWVAASVRATAIARRRLGAAGARSLAASRDLPEALTTLAQSPYGHDVRPTQTLPEAQHAVTSTVLWHLRVLAGWAPREGSGMLRALAAGFEVANVDVQVARITGQPAGDSPPYRLGALSTAGGRLAEATSLVELRAVLAGSAWGDPGVDTARAIAAGMRLSWLARVARTVPAARTWAAGAGALVAARQVLVDERPGGSAQARWTEQLLGRGWADAHTVADLVRALPPSAAWALADVEAPADLWLAEAAWWHRVQREGFVLLHRRGFDAETLLGSVAVLATDAWRVRAALEVASRGSAAAREAFDAVA